MKKLLIIIAITGALAVILGAFGAHALKDQLSEQSLSGYKTGVQYHFIHTLAALLSLIIWDNKGVMLLRYAVICFLVGILLFSGSLYLLTTQTLSGISAGWLGPITPIGGLFFIAGWILVVMGAFKIK